MLHAKVIGHATSTVKHSSLNGWRMLLVQPLKSDGSREGIPFIAIDELGSRVGQKVILASDGKFVSEAMGTKNTPVRWMVIAQPDDQPER
ncbi:Ethanolamine utilization protein EutN/carboxysome [Thalassoglobus neptunius]|uniref:Ethanolamine utilization protein EutN/carboxysome n=1 Tax=Thalassoglobus neptunius TaxID=1938619 RepID=A0A5C5X4Q4_9PLAN|nr:EutN/CcmL family microcompartment protein [Thalassoglobus neptunius]TWT57986.1 Ethanolamine utilization protein EutN/carboxysome [Thalassoglobus neptunius]